jgi:hypothetical protein
MGDGGGGVVTGGTAPDGTAPGGGVPGGGVVTGGTAPGGGVVTGGTGVADEGRADPGGLPARRGPLFWLSALAGWGFIAWGVRGALHFHFDTRPPELARFFVGGALLHDLIFAPVVLAAGVGIARVVPRRARAYVQATLIISGCLALVAYPEVRDYARVLNNPTSLPYNYTVNLLIAVAAVGTATTAVAVVRMLWGRRGASSDPS